MDEEAAIAQIAPQPTFLQTWLPLTVILAPVFLAGLIEVLRHQIGSGRVTGPSGVTMVLGVLPMVAGSMWIWTGRKRLSRSLVDLVSISATFLALANILSWLMFREFTSMPDTEPTWQLWALAATALVMGAVAWPAFFVVRLRGLGLNQCDPARPVSTSDLLITTTLICISLGIGGGLQRLEPPAADHGLGVLRTTAGATRPAAAYDPEFEPLNPLTEPGFYVQLGMLNLLVLAILAPVYLVARKRHVNSPVPVSQQHQRVTLTVCGMAFAGLFFGLLDSDGLWSGLDFPGSILVMVFGVWAWFVLWTVLFLCVAGKAERS